MGVRADSEIELDCKVYKKYEGDNENNDSVNSWMTKRMDSAVGEYL